MHKKLLTVDSNAKTVKGQKYGFMTGILYMAPADISGRNVCSMAEIAGCKAACLYTAGRGAMNSVQAARISKAKFFFSNRQAFMEILVKDIKALVRKAGKKGMIPLVRLNGTSDIKWENVRFDYGFGNEQITIQKYVNQAIESGMRIAAVFRKRSDIPAKFLGLDCIDGDNTDIRHIDRKGVIVALYAKGKAKKDTSGFVIDTPKRLIPLQLAA